MSFGSSVITERDKEIIRALCRDATVYEVAAELCLSKHALDGHLLRLYKLLGCRVHRRHSILLAAMRHGIITRETAIEERRNERARAGL